MAAWISETTKTTNVDVLNIQIRKEWKVQGFITTIIVLLTGVVISSSTFLNKES